MRISKFLRKLLFRTAQGFRIFFYRMLSNAILKGESPILRQPLQAVGRGVIEFEERVSIGFFPSPSFFSSYAYLNESSKISIGHDTSINNGFVAIAEYSHIKIGARVLIGINVEIIDSDFHGINLLDRNKSKPEWAKPVEVGDDVFLGSNVRICKGVTIGNGSVVANGSIVIQDIPARVVAAGNPATVLRTIS